MPSCLRLLLHWVRLAASRTFWTAGTSRPISTAMMAITTNSSISVNADRVEERCIGSLHNKYREYRKRSRKRGSKGREGGQRALPTTPPGEVNGKRHRPVWWRERHPAGRASRPRGAARDPEMGGDDPPSWVLS